MRIPEGSDHDGIDGMLHKLLTAYNTGDLQDEKTTWICWD